MKDSMIPYIMLRNEKGLEQDALIMELVEYSQYIFIDEHYCCKPTCTCNNVVLTFLKLQRKVKLKESY